MPAYNNYFANYIRLTQGSNVPDALEHSTNICLSVLNGLTEEQGDFRYAEGKWSIKELVCHMIDTERIMAYRALCIARKEEASLPGYDELGQDKAEYHHRYKGPERKNHSCPD